MLVRFPVKRAAITLTLIMVLSLPTLLPANPPRLQISGTPVAWGSSCDSGEVVVAGSRFFLTVVNTADHSLHSLKPGWPNGYSFEAALDLSDAQPYLPTPGLIEHLTLVPYLCQLNRSAEKRLTSHPNARQEPTELNIKSFALTIPADLAGHTISLRAHYSNANADLTSKPLPSLHIVAPCDQSDTARIVSQWIYEAWDDGSYPRVIELADSMLASGLTDAPGWSIAVRVATGMKLFDKAIAYLQRMYEDFGVLNVELYTSHPPRLNRGWIHGPGDRETFERARDKYLELKAENEQQH
jgi:hypothetical protein